MARKPRHPVHCFHATWNGNRRIFIDKKSFRSDGRPAMGAFDRGSRSRD
jgi:hypothetical protein